MVDSINNVRAGEVVQPEEQEQKQQYNISYRGNDFERTPESDSFESENKTGKTVGIIGGLLATAAVVVGGICLHKGGKALEGKDASLKEKLEAGWKELRGKGGKGVKDAETKPENKTENKPAEETTKTEATAKTKAETTKVEINEETMKEYLSGLPEDTQKDVIESINETKELGANLSFGIDENGAKFLNVEYSSDVYKNGINKMFEGQFKDKTLLLKTLSDITAKKAEALPMKFSLNLSSKEAYKESQAAYDKVFNDSVLDKFESEIATEFSNLLNEDKEFAKNILKESVGEEKFAELSDSEVEESIKLLVEEFKKMC